MAIKHLTLTDKIMIGIMKENISYKYIFTAEERADNAQNLAHAQVHRVELEDEKKAVTSEYKAKIDAQTSLVNLISRHVIDGFTTKTKYALKRKNFAAKLWEWVDEDTGEVLKTEKLTGKDLQQDIPFQKPEKPFDDNTGEVNAQEPVGGDEPLPQAPPLPPMEAFLNTDRPAMPALDAVVTPDVEDLDNGTDRMPESVSDVLLLATAFTPQSALPSGETKSDESTASDDSEDNEGIDFDADAYNPDDEQPAKPTKPKRPRK